MATERIPAAGYIRMSSPKQETSPAQQRREILALCGREHARPPVGPQMSERAEDSACVASSCAALFVGSAAPAATPGAAASEPEKLS
jgi:hypothetical protein